MRFALDDAAREFRKLYPDYDLQVAYGSSGNFYSQIRNQAPFDVFLSADVEYPRRLAADGMGVAGSLFVYAEGRIVAWAPRNAAANPEALLRSPSVRHVAIANPRHAPYGRAAEAALRSLGIYGSVEKKLVYGENVMQTFEFVQSGAAEVGIVALSLALAPAAREGRYWEIPRDAYPRMQQGGLILKPSTAASAFRAWITGASGRRLLERYGFSAPGR